MITDELIDELERLEKAPGCYYGDCLVADNLAQALRSGGLKELIFGEGEKP